MKGFNYLVNSKVTQISVRFAKEQNIPVELAMEQFLISTTYQVLNEKDTGVYLEVVEFVYDMFLEEVGENAGNTD